MLSTATFVFLVNPMNTGYKLINRADSPETMPLTGRQQGKPLPMEEQSADAVPNAKAADSAPQVYKNPEKARALIDEFKRGLVPH